MNRLMSDNHFSARRRRATNDSESSESSIPDQTFNGGNAGRPPRARRTRSRRCNAAMTRSLPLEASTLTLAEPQNGTGGDGGGGGGQADTTDTKSTLTQKDSINKSTVSSITADPSSSSGGCPNSTANNSSVAPSTSSGDGSVHVQNIITTAAAANSKMIDSSASLVQTLNAKIQVSEARVHKLEAEIKPRLVSMELPLKDLRSQLFHIRETVTTDKEYFGIMIDEFRREVVANLEALESDNAREVLRIKDLAQRTRKQSESNMEALRYFLLVSWVLKFTLISFYEEVFYLYEYIRIRLN